MQPFFSKRSASHYSYSFALLPAIFHILLGIHSSVSRDAAILLKNVKPAPRALNVKNIPPDSPFVLSVNHYDRPGLGEWWSASLAICAIAERRTGEPREVRFIFAREWFYPRGFGKWVKQPLTRWFFGQVAKTYGMLTLPPAIERYRGTAAPAILRILSFSRSNQPDLIGLAPEGHTGRNGALLEPPEGTGLLLLLLTREKIPILPAGIFEDEDHALTINFGAPFDLRVPREVPRDARDHEAKRQVMVAIGKLLPERMWGVYREEIKG